MRYRYILVLCWNFPTDFHYCNDSIDQFYKWFMSFWFKSCNKLLCCYMPICHYNDVIMSAMVSQITSLMIVYSTIYSRCGSKKTSKLRITGLCVGNSPVTGEFPAQRDSNMENVSIWWRHHGSDQATNFAHVITTQLSWHVQNLDLTFIIAMKIKGKRIIKISIRSS